jgi:hypothetical protein
MRTQISILVLACSLAGCAAGPQSSQTATSEQTTKQLAAESTTSAGTSAGDSAKTVEVKQRVPPGYRASTKDGVLVYCKSSATLGSRFEREVCLTPEAYKEVEATAERNRQDLKKAIGICSGAGPCGGG